VSVQTQVTQTAQQTGLLTADEFWALYGDQDEFADGMRLHYELINGEAVDVPMPGFKHGQIQRRTAARLGDFADAAGLGEVATEIHCILAPDIVRVPDVAFIRTENMRKIVDPQKPLPFAPDLAIEIISPGNTVSEMRQKLDLYFAAGTLLVWWIYPDLQSVEVHHPDRTARMFIMGETLDGGDVLPGLSILVASLFPPEPVQDRQ